MSDNADAGLERELETLACYHCGLFTGAISARHGLSPDLIAHALWYLAREAEARRKGWLREPGPQPEA